MYKVLYIHPAKADARCGPFPLGRKGGPGMSEALYQKLGVAVNRLALDLLTLSGGNVPRRIRRLLCDTPKRVFCIMLFCICIVVFGCCIFKSEHNGLLSIVNNICSEEGICYDITKSGEFNKFKYSCIVNSIACIFTEDERSMRTYKHRRS